MVEDFPLRIGVVADTHVPDRMSSLHPCLLEGLRAQNISIILHAGDISSPDVITQLEQVAPVKAAFGNRDWAFSQTLPWVHHLALGGVEVALMHGHGSWGHYFWDKWVYAIQGYRFKRYQRLVTQAAPDARVIVFGHTHHAECVWVGQQLIFNPGAASRGFRKGQMPSFGVLEVNKGGEISGKILPLEGYKAEAGNWVRMI